MFVAPDESCKTIRLGKIDRKSAESICRHVEALLAAKIARQPVPRDTAVWLASIRAVLRDKPVGSLVWGGTWARDGQGAEMLRRDLETAGIPYAVEGPDGPLYADFHSLRHTYLTLGGQAGIDWRTLQELAGHSSPLLTARYSHRQLYDLAGAVEKLPNFLPSPDAPACVRAALPATRTDGRIRTDGEISLRPNGGNLLPREDV